MTPKEKAIELIKIYEELLFKELEYGYNKDLPIKIALVSINKLLKYIPKKTLDIYRVDSKNFFIKNVDFEYLKKVKQEIEKL